MITDRVLAIATAASNPPYFPRELEDWSAEDIATARLVAEKFTSYANSAEFYLSERTGKGE